MIFDPFKVLFATAIAKGVSPKLRESLQAIRPEMLRNTLHAEIYNAVMALDNFGASITLDAVHAQIDSAPFFEIVEVQHQVMPTDNPMREAMQIINYHNDEIAKRELSEVLSKLSSGRVFDRNELSEKLSKLSANIAPVAENKPVSFAEYAESYIDVIEQRQSNHGGQFLDIGLDVDIDQTALIVLGGQPGMGKTAAALYIINEVGLQNKKCLMFSLEMGGNQLFERQVGAKSGVSTIDLKRIGRDGYDLPDDKWAMVGPSLKWLSEMPIFIDDQPNLSLPIFKKKVRDFKESNPDLSLIVVDYLTLMSMPDAQSRALSVGEVTRGMKMIAKELKTPILLLSQLNRESDKAAREPRNSDLRDSGSIEQDADIIIFPYREEVHKPDTPNKGLARILKTKVRDGEVGEFLLEFKGGSFFKTNRQLMQMQEEPNQRRKF